MWLYYCCHCYHGNNHASLQLQDHDCTTSGSESIRTYSTSVIIYSQHGDNGPYRSCSSCLYLPIYRRQ